jgi:hypothetical protein
MIKSITEARKSDKNKLIKIWLLACLAKTIKEQVNLKEPVAGLAN